MNLPHGNCGNYTLQFTQCKEVAQSIKMTIHSVANGRNSLPFHIVVSRKCHSSHNQPERDKQWRYSRYFVLKGKLHQKLNTHLCHFHICPPVSSFWQARKATGVGGPYPPSFFGKNILPRSPAGMSPRPIIKHPELCYP